MVIYAHTYHCSIFKCEMLRKSIRIMSRGLIVTGQCAIIRGCCSENDIWAKLPQRKICNELVRLKIILTL